MRVRTQSASELERRKHIADFEQVNHRLSMAQQFAFYQLQKFGFQFICLRGCLNNMHLLTFKGNEVLAIDVMGEIAPLADMYIRQ